MADKKKSKMSQKARFVLFGLLSLVAMLACMAVVIGSAMSMITEGVYEFPEEEKASLTELPVGSDAIVGYLDAMLEKATDDTRVFLKKEVEAGISGDTIDYSGTEAELKVLNYMKGTVLSGIDGIYPENYEGSFGDGYKDYPRIYLTEDELSSASCAKGRQNDKGETVDSDLYFAELTAEGGAFPEAEGTGIYKTFGLQDSMEIAGKIKETLSPVIALNKSEITPAGFVVKAQINRLRDEIRYLELVRNYKVKFSFSFTGELSSLGAKELSFDYCVREKFNYTWASLNFEKDCVNIALNESVSLPLKAVMNDDSEYSVTFESSDESVVTVDEMGYVTGKQYTKTPVEVSASLTYLGHEYRTVCQVLVTVPVKGLKLECDKLSLNVGESHALTSVIEPKDATITDVIYISEDESIATVSQDGTVKALKAGNVKIIAVSVDGHFRDSCDVTVNA